VYSADDAGVAEATIAPNAEAHAYASDADADTTGPAQLTAPLTPGNYEVRYVTAGVTVLTRIPMTVTAVAVSIEKPESVVAGVQFELGWQGPNNSGDWLTIVNPDAAAQA
jgi:Ca-activated chloride channel homolog